MKALWTSSGLRSRKWTWVRREKSSSLEVPVVCEGSMNEAKVRFQEGDGGHSCKHGTSSKTAFNAPMDAAVKAEWVIGFKVGRVCDHYSDF